MKNFIFTKKPHVITIGGESREALMIAEDIKGIISDLVDSEQFPSIAVEIVDNELAKVNFLLSICTVEIVTSSIMF